MGAAAPDRACPACSSCRKSSHIGLGANSSFVCLVAARREGLGGWWPVPLAAGADYLPTGTTRADKGIRVFFGSMTEDYKAMTALKRADAG